MRKGENGGVEKIVSKRENFDLITIDTSKSEHNFVL